MFEAQCPDQFCIYIEDVDSPEDNRSVTCCPSGKQCCSTGCFDTLNDRNHCGSSCNQCLGGENCIEGHCVCVDPVACATACGECSVYRDGKCRRCPQGMPCVNGVCTCGSYNYCHHRDLGWMCVSGDCSLVA